MNPTVKHIYIIASIILAFVILWRFTEPKESPNLGKIRKDSVDYIKPIAPVTNNYATHITYQTKIDSAKRKEAEKEPIITGVKIEGNEVSIQKIDSAGKITEEKHEVEEGSKVLIDNKGFEEKKRTKTGKLLRKAGKVALKGLAVIGGIAIVYTAIK
jgi:hypothetical protein